MFYMPVFTLLNRKEELEVLYQDLETLKKSTRKSLREESHTLEFSIETNSTFLHYFYY